ncbi:MAG: rod shape-determining protein MreD, partial [Pseudomonadota bacterium]
VAVAVEAAPLGLAPGSVPSPDLLALTVAVMAVRRPDAVPTLLVFALGLMRDLLTDLPVGAGALGLVLLAEALKGESAAINRHSLLREWALVAAALFAMMAFQYILTLATLAQPPYIMAVVRQWALSVAAWPAVFALMRGLFGIRAPSLAPAGPRQPGPTRPGAA